MNAFTAPKTMSQRIVETTTTPGGEAGIIIECDCQQHTQPTRAILRGDGATLDLSQIQIHRLVELAHHPLFSRAKSNVENGPWAI
jgi:hypothetical protein